MSKKTVVTIIGVISAIYLINPTFGVFEFIPDNIPFIGNLDEATATYLLLGALAYHGIDLRDVFESKSKEQRGKE